jgi:hypothetical protein
MILRYYHQPCVCCGAQIHATSQWLLNLWLCGVLASGQPEPRSLAIQPWPMPPVNQLNSLRTPTEFATSQGCGQSGSAPCSSSAGPYTPSCQLRCLAQPRLHGLLVGEILVFLLFKGKLIKHANHRTRLDAVYLDN